MSTISKFEDLEVWQKARKLTKEIYLLTDENKFRKDFVLSQQIRKPAISVVSNIAEGFARRTNKEFIQFLYISHGSIAEIEAQLYLALDLTYITQQIFNELYNFCYEISKMIMGLIKYLTNYSFKNSSTHKLTNPKTK
jgi:four helix bundle protein